MPKRMFLHAFLAITCDHRTIVLNGVLGGITNHYGSLVSFSGSQRNGIRFHSDSLSESFHITVHTKLTTNDSACQDRQAEAIRRGQFGSEFCIGGLPMAIQYSVAGLHQLWECLRCAL